MANCLFNYWTAEDTNYFIFTDKVSVLVGDSISRYMYDNKNHLSLKGTKTQNMLPVIALTVESVYGPRLKLECVFEKNELYRCR